MASMRGAGHRALRVDFYRVATVADVAARVVRAYKALPADSGRLLDRLSRDLGLTIAPTGVTVHVGPKGDRAAPDAEQSRQILLEGPRHPASPLCGRRNAHRRLLRRVPGSPDRRRPPRRVVPAAIQHHTKAAAYVYAGSRPTLMRAMFSDHERPFYAQARPLTLPRLPADETIRHIGAVLERHGVAA